MRDPVVVIMAGGQAQDRDQTRIVFPSERVYSPVVFFPSKESDCVLDALPPLGFSIGLSMLQNGDGNRCRRPSLQRPGTHSHQKPSSLFIHSWSCHSTRRGFVQEIYERSLTVLNGGRQVVLVDLLGELQGTHELH
jgi:hypothetical protein